MKKKIKNLSAAMWLSALPVVFFASCGINDDSITQDSTEVMLTFTTRAPGDNTDPDVLSGEGMKHLRIIVEEDNHTIRYNYTHTFTDEETSHTINFNDLYAGRTYHFYAIANESSFDGNFEGKDLDVITRLKGTQLRSDQLDKLIEKGLPATGSLTLQHLDESKSLYEQISLKRAVAKANLTFRNETGQTQVLTDVKLANASATSTFLLESAGEKPEGTREVAWGEVKVPETGFNAVRYLYENQSDAGYKLTAIWNGKLYELPLLDGNQPVTEIPRNKQLNISVTLEGSTAYDCRLLCEILPWSPVKLNPEFQ